ATAESSFRSVDEIWLRRSKSLLASLNSKALGTYVAPLAAAVFSSSIARTMRLPSSTGWTPPPGNARAKNPSTRPSRRFSNPRRKLILLPAGGRDGGDSILQAAREIETPEASGLLVKLRSRRPSFAGDWRNMADAHGSGPCELTLIGVQIPGPPLG